MYGNETSLYYAIYIEASAEKIWEAIISPVHSGIYWGHNNVSDWQCGSSWSHQRMDGSGIADVIGEIIEIQPTEYLKFTWEDPGNPGKNISTATIKLFSEKGITRLSIMHENLPDKMEKEVTYGGWVAVLSNLKTYVETGNPMSINPWEIAE